MWNICFSVYLHVCRLYRKFLVKNVQGLYQMLEDKVSIRCRQKDEKLVTVSIQHLNVYFIYICK